MSTNFDFLNGYLCISDIPTEKLKKGPDGRIYLGYTISKMKQEDTHGNTHTMFVRESKEDRENGVERVWLGKGKSYELARSRKIENPDDLNDLPGGVTTDDLNF